MTVAPTTCLGCGEPVAAEQACVLWLDEEMVLAHWDHRQYAVRAYRRLQARRRQERVHMPTSAYRGRSRVRLEDMFRRGDEAGDPEE